MRTRRSIAAVTLTELLIVLMLLGVLTTLAVAFVSKAQRSGRDTQCIANLRAAGLATIQLAFENNGEFFSTKFWYSQASFESPKGIRDYLGFGTPGKRMDAAARENFVDSLLTCPQMKALLPAKFPSLMNRTYSMNYYLLTKDPNPIYNGKEELRPSLEETPKRMNSIPNASSMWLFTDGASDDAGGSTIQTTCKENAPIKWMFYHHSGHNNVVFLDGHVERLTKAQFTNPKSKREFWGNLLALD